MIVSLTRPFIVISIPKTGSVSVTHSLRRYDLGIKKACELTGGSPKHETQFMTTQYPYHITAAELKHKLGDRYAEALTFTFVRNPWDRIVSFAHYGKRMRKEESFPCFIKRCLASSGKMPFFSRLKPTGTRENVSRNSKSCSESPLPAPQLSWVQDKNKKIIVDFIGRFEKLEEDYATVCNKIGIPVPKLPHANKSQHKHYTEYYDDETREIITEAYKEDVEYFDYEFGE